MVTRILSGMLLLPLLMIIFIKGVPLYILGLITSVLAIKEFTDALKNKNLNIYPHLGYTLSIIIFFKNLLNLNNLNTIITVICLILIYVVFIIAKKENIKQFIFNILGIIYIIIGFDAIVSVTKMPNGDKFVWLIFIIALLSDTMAYFTGNFLGKHKLAPKLSPKKTIEGSLGAIISSMLGCVIFGYIFKLNIVFMIILGFIGSIISQIGDLLASFVKRHVEIKDYGNLIPGHGGILDRFDSIILVSQFIYISIYLISIF